MRSIIVVGLQWGDEGKGKAIDRLSETADWVVRAHGGNNAGHTVLVGEEEYKFHLIPSGILYPSVRCVIGGGTVVDPAELLKEIEGLISRGVKVEGRLHLSPYAHVVFPYHRLLDRLYETRKGAQAIGTTGRGIGPCYADRALRIGIRVAELIRPEILRSRLEEVVAIKNAELKQIFNHEPISFEELFEESIAFGKKLAPFVSNAEKEIAEALSRKEKIVFEGAHGTLLDILYGTYPFVTSSNTLSSGVATGIGVGAHRIDHVLGIVKAYTTRVGAGPFPTAFTDQEQAQFMGHSAARELGTTTGRQRKMGWLDLCLLRLAVRMNGVDSLAITKMDILDGVEQIKMCVGYRLNGKTIEEPPVLTEDFNLLEPIYEVIPGWKASTREAKRWEDLPLEARNYLDCIQTLLQVPVSLVSVGPEREKTLWVNRGYDLESAFS